MLIVAAVSFHYRAAQDQEVDSYRWLDEVREDGRMVGGEGWQEKVYDREEWKRLLRTARNHRILYMPMD